MVDCAQKGSGIMFIKPLEPDAITNVNVVTNRRVYSLVLRAAADSETRGSSRARANKYSLSSWSAANPGSRGFQYAQHRHSAAVKLESATIGGNMLVVAEAKAEEVAEFVVSPTEPGR